jgi:hypothetical protein
MRLNPVPLAVARQIGVKRDASWLIKQKLTEVMRRRNAAYRHRSGTADRALDVAETRVGPPESPALEPPAAHQTALG